MTCAQPQAHSKEPKKCTCDKSHLVVEPEALGDEIVVQACHDVITSGPPAMITSSLLYH